MAVNGFGLRSAPPSLGASVSGVPVPAGHVILTVDASDPNGDRFPCRDLRFDVRPLAAVIGYFTDDLGLGFDLLQGVSSGSQRSTSTSHSR